MDKVGSHQNDIGEDVTKPQTQWQLKQGCAVPSFDAAGNKQRAGWQVRYGLTLEQSLLCPTSFFLLSRPSLTLTSPRSIVTRPVFSVFLRIKLSIPDTVR